jgi:hypothetical protein
VGKGMCRRGGLSPHAPAGTSPSIRDGHRRCQVQSAAPLLTPCPQRHLATRNDPGSHLAIARCCTDLRHRAPLPPHLPALRLGSPSPHPDEVLVRHCHPEALLPHWTALTDGPGLSQVAWRRRKERPSLAPTQGPPVPFGAPQVVLEG